MSARVLCKVPHRYILRLSHLLDLGIRTIVIILVIITIILVVVVLLLLLLIIIITLGCWAEMILFVSPLVSFCLPSSRLSWML